MVKVPISSTSPFSVQEIVTLPVAPAGDFFK
jgi:hypothetical protein